MTGSTAPAGLGKSGKALWSSIAGSYALRPDEAMVLEDACHTADLLSALTGAWVEDGSPMTTKGSMGQLVIHPFIAEMDRHRKSRASLLRQLALPDVDAAPVENQHRSAAQAKWSARGA